MSTMMFSANERPAVPETIGIAATAVPVAPVPPETSCGEVYDRLRAEPDTFAIPVVRDGKPIGLVNRFDLTMSLAHDYGRALYAKKSITVRMDANPLIVDSDTAIDELEWMIAANRPAALTRGYIVVRQELYLGVGTALTLLQLSMQRSEQRNRQIEDARSAAEAANRAKSRFLAVMSHELRTPLNAVIGFSDLMRNGIFGPLGDARYSEYLNDIHTSAQSLLALINDILDTAKIDSGKMELFEEPIDLEEQVNSALRIIAPRAVAASVQLETQLSPNLPILHADRRAIRQILLNLLSNAVKFSPNGKVTVTVCEEANGGVSLNVADTGIGMSTDEIDVALSPFGQIANVHTRVHDGTGLGLPLVKSLALLHGASFSIKSQPGAGTAVTIVFPATRVTRETKPALARILPLPELLAAD
jgi:two-component system, cell cycle sensor histidine kinase PleC